MATLKKTLTTRRGAGLMLNIVVGAGLLALPGIVVKEVGNHAIWSWLICAIIALPLLSVFIIMGKRFPNAGGIAHFAEIAFGQAFYSIASFLFMGAVAFGLPAVALTGGYYLAEIFPYPPVLFAVGIVFFAALSHLISPEIAGKISSFVASTILLSLLFLITVGFFAIEWSNVENTIIPLSKLDLSLAFLPFMMIFFAFTGWEVAASTAEEFKNPGRDFPLAMLLSFVAACFLYFAMAFIVQNIKITGAYEAAFVSIAEIVFGTAGKTVLAILVGFIIYANLMGAIWAVSRMVFALSRAQYLPFKLKTRANGTPASAIYLTLSIPMIVLSLDWFEILNINNMLAIAAQNFLILYGITALSLGKLTTKLSEKILSFASLIIIAILLVAEGTSILYPTGLCVAAIIIWYVRKSKIAQSENAETAIAEKKPSQSK